jgi:hypothetical protein
MCIGNSLAHDARSAVGAKLVLKLFLPKCVADKFVFAMTAIEDEVLSSAENKEIALSEAVGAVAVNNSG